MSCPAPDVGCAEIRSNYSTLENFYQYKTDYLNTTAVANYIRTDAAKALSEGTANEKDYQDNLSSLQLFEARASRMAKCLQQEITSRQCQSSKIYTLEQDTKRLREELSDKRQTVKDAKERARLLEDPYSQTTVHALWFPLGRPLQKESVPVLLSISLLFLILSLGMFLRLMNIGFEFKLPEFSLGGEGTTSGLAGIGLQNPFYRKYQ